MVGVCRLTVNRDQFNGRLQQLVGIIEECWGSVTDAPSLAARGRKTQFKGRILAERGLSTAQADRQLREFLYRHRDWKINA